MMKFKQLLAGLLVLSSTLSASAQFNPNNIPAVMTLAKARLLLQPTPPVIYVSGTTTPGDGIQGEFFWNSSSNCTDDSGQSCIKPTTQVGSGRFVRVPEGWNVGGVTPTGGVVVSGTIGQSTVNTVPIGRTDAQFLATNNGLNIHPLISLEDRYVECSGTPIATVTGSSSGTTFTQTSGPVMTTSHILCGAIGGWGSVVMGTTIIAGAGPYTLSKSQTLPPGTYYEYPAGQESAVGYFGLNSTGDLRTMGSYNTTWADNDPSSYSAGCLETGDAATTNVICNILAFGNGGLILGYTAGGGNYHSPGAGMTQVWASLSTRGQLFAGTASISPQLVISAQSGQDATIDMIRPATNRNGYTRYCNTDCTGSNVIWAVGFNPAITFSNDFHITNGINTDVMTITNSNNKVTFTSDVRSNGVFNASGNPGLTTTCSVTPTSITITGGIITAKSGGTCT